MNDDKNLEYVSLLCSNKNHNYCALDNCACFCHNEQESSILESKDDFKSAFIQFVYEIWLTVKKDSEAKYNYMDFSNILHAIDNKFGYPECGDNKDMSYVVYNCFQDYVSLVMTKTPDDFNVALIIQDIDNIIYNYCEYFKYSNITITK